MNVGVSRVLNSYDKSKPVKLSDHFSSDEFDCPCSSCDKTLIDSNLIARLEVLRKIIGAAIVIDSGYRCQYYQDQLKARGYETATGVSQHTLGLAADIRSDSRSGADLTVFAAEAGFMAIGTGKWWIHIDCRSDKERRWDYAR
jgi:uncharacterized protein YcbK (DUF882 family)